MIDYKASTVTGNERPWRWERGRGEASTAMPLSLIRVSKSISTLRLFVLTVSATALPA